MSTGILVKLVGIIIVIIAIIMLAGFTNYEPNVIAPTPTPTPTGPTAVPLPPIQNATVMEEIIPDELPGEWEYETNHIYEGRVVMRFSKTISHIVTISVYDKRTGQLAAYAVTPDNFSYDQGSIDWSFSETIYNNAPAMKGTYYDDDTLMGELIAYPHDRYLVVAYIVGEDDKIVKMDDLLESLEFT